LRSKGLEENGRKACKNEKLESISQKLEVAKEDLSARKGCIVGCRIKTDLSKASLRRLHPYSTHYFTADHCIDTDRHDGKELMVHDTRVLLWTRTSPISFRLETLLLGTLGTSSKHCITYSRTQGEK
jgi:hypothetical protein